MRDLKQCLKIGLVSEAAERKRSVLRQNLLIRDLLGSLDVV